MENSLQSYIEAAASYVFNEKVVLNEDLATKISSDYAKISSAVFVSSENVKGLMAEADAIWSGEASEKFFNELSAAITVTAEISEKVNHNKKQLDRAIAILSNADESVKNNVVSLSGTNIFQNL